MLRNGYERVPLGRPGKVARCCGLWFCGHVHGLWRADPATGCINVGGDV